MTRATVNDQVKKVNRSRLYAYCKKSTSMYICVICNVGLHIGGDGEINCFADYHTKDTFNCCENIAQVEI